MTTFAKSTVTCGACRHLFTYHALASTNAFGSPDLDTRPPEMKRSTMRAWVQRCPSCGYCAADVSAFDERFRPVMESSVYRAQLADARYPELASTFICAALLYEAAGRRGEAGWAYLKAAWALDDGSKDELARSWRGKAADLFCAIIAEGQSFVQQPGASEAVLTDCLRRAGRGAEALSIIDQALSKVSEDIIRKVLEFERVLIQRGDASRHLIKEAIENA